uniref:Uncharacterized protein n=1 Tax=Rhizophagus irregularis (strain DAOM 181602 / DAOM 197198 / MUCL 43194) TaxID=747089 RepID=U9T484_RHIID
MLIFWTALWIRVYRHLRYRLGKRVAATTGQMKMAAVHFNELMCHIAEQGISRIS